MTQWTWTAADGTVVPLSDWSNGVYVLEGLKKQSQGTLGQFAPEYDFAEQTFAGVDGSSLQQVIVPPRQPQIGVEMVGDDASMRARLRVWGHAMRPRAGIGRLTAIADDGSSRYLPCYYRSGLDAVMYQSGRARMALRFWAPSPWYRGVPITSDYGLAAPTAFFPITPVVLSASTVQGMQTLDLSDTDAPTFPVWTITGPGDTLTLTNTTTGQQLVLAGPLTAGQTVTIDTRPGMQSIMRQSPAPTSLVEQRRNLVTNPHGRVNFNSWGAYGATGGAGSSSQVAAGGPDGGEFIRRTQTAASTAQPGYMLAAGMVSGAGTLIPVTPGVTYSGSIYGRCSAARPLAATIAFYTSTPANLSIVGSATGPVATVPANTWQRLASVGAVAPAGAVYAFIGVDEGSAGPLVASGETIDGTMAMLEARADDPGDYFDGSTSPTATNTYAWTGTTDSSASTLSSPVVSGPVPAPVSIFGQLGSDPAMWGLIDGVNVVSAVLVNAGAGSRITMTADRLYSGAL